MDFLHVLMVLAIAAIVIYGVQIIAVKFFVGDVDKAFEGNGTFNPRTSLNKTLNRKMTYYRRIKFVSMRWLVFYSNLLLPIITVVSIWGSISMSLEEGFVPDAHFYLYLAFGGATLLTSILVRGIDTMAFYVNFLPSIMLLACAVFPWSGFNGVLLIALIVVVPAIGLNAWYFIRRKELFFLSLRQMKQKVEEIGAQNES